MRSHESQRRLSIERIEAAVTSIDPLFLDTPQFESESLSAALGVRAVLKVETVNPIRSFKGRGASLYMSQAPLGTEVICASAGNFGQAMAYAGRGRGIAVTVYAAEQANPLKVERMRALGANVVLFGDDFDELGRRLQDDVGPELERPLPQRRGERGINDGQGAALAGARRDGGDVGDDEQRVGD